MPVSTHNSHTHCQVAQSKPHKPKLVKEYGCPNAEKRKEKKHENTTRYIVHGFLTSATTPYTERCKQLKNSNE